ncbi:MAG: DUF169 domain-containing protein [Candidatus Lokiarchaeota archaeon]|nr:DUF169 domain-containing protein [Candidatus Lokiarchaeota archaeon]
MNSKIKTLEDYQKVGVEIFNELHLDSYPISIKYIRDIEKDIPAGVRRPIDNGEKMSICQAFTYARKFRHKLCITAADNFCTPSSVAHGWVPLSMEEFTESQLRQKWSKDIQAEKRRAEHIYAKNFKNIIELAYRGVIISPLMETPVIPDAILIYCDGPKLTYIINALNYEHKRKYRIQSMFEGFGESCGKGGLMPFITRKAQIVIPGTGDRSFAGIQDHELGIGMPASFIFYVLENLFQTGSGQGLRFPLRQLLPKLDENLTPGFRYMREVIDKKLNEKNN